MANPYFNAVYYLQQNPDVFSAGYTVATAWDHYVKHGANEANVTGGTFRAPNPWFDVKYYLANNPDLVRAGITPATALDHFLTFGSTAGEDRAPNATIAAAPITEAKLLAYAKANADLQTAFGISATATTLTAAQQTSLLNHFYAYGYNETRADKPAAVTVPDVDAGKTFTLTTGIDNLVGTSGDDTFIGDNSGASATVTAGDQIDGAAGVDTFNYYGAAAAVVMPQMKNIEVLNLYGTAVTNLNTATVAGLEKVNLVNVTTAVDIGGGTGTTTLTLGAAQALGLNNVTQTGVTFVTADFGATATAATLNVSNGSSVQTVELNGAAIKTLNVGSTGSKENTIATLTSTGAEDTLKVSGNQKLTITNALDASVKTIDASAQTAGGVTVSAGNADVKFTGGAGNDTITFAATQFTSKDVINGGAGKDTVIVTDAAAAITGDVLKAVNAITNVEVLGFAAAVGASLDASTITSVDTFLIANAGANGFINAAASDSFIVNTGGGAVTSLTVANKVGEQSTKVTLDNQVAGATAANSTLATLTVTEANTINIESAGKAANVITTLAVANNSKVVITGAKDLTISNAVAATASGQTIDAASLTGKLTVQGSGFNDIMTVGSGGSALTASAGNDSYTFGAGKDVITYTAATQSGNGSTTNLDVITSFGANDQLNLDAVTAATTVKSQASIQAAVNAGAPADFAAAVALAATAVGADGVGAFQFQGNTYVLAQNNTAGYDAGDALIKLVGELTITADNIVLA